MPDNQQLQTHGLNMSIRATLFVGYLLYYTATLAGATVQAAAYDNRIDLDFSVVFDTGGGQRSLYVAETTLIKQFIATRTQVGCTSLPWCTVRPSNISIEQQEFEVNYDNASEMRTWHLQTRVHLTSQTVVLAVQAAGSLEEPVIRAAIAEESPGFFSEEAIGKRPYRLMFHGNLDASFSELCGDGMVQNFEQCDDGNLQDGDGCSPLCALEANTMCYASIRTAADKHGSRVGWDSEAVNGTRRLVVLAHNESCVSAQLCNISVAKWEPSVWEALYAKETEPNITLPPAGFYCSSFCRDTFVAPKHYEFRDSCEPEPVVALEHVLSVDVFLGLVGDNTLFNDSLVQDLDLTRRSSGPLRRDMQRDTSTTASNVVTLLVKGDEVLFSKGHATKYTLAVEDIFTMHFLENSKKMQVQDMLDQGRAFTSVQQPAHAHRCVLSRCVLRAFPCKGAPTDQRLV